MELGPQKGWEGGAPGRRSAGGIQPNPAESGGRQKLRKTDSDCLISLIDEYCNIETINVNPNPSSKLLIKFKTINAENLFLNIEKISLNNSMPLIRLTK